MNIFELQIDEEINILKNTTMRLRYIFSDYNFEYENNKIIITAEKINEEEIKREVFYYLYKEKVYKDNLSIRKKIYESI